MRKPWPSGRPRFQARRCEPAGSGRGAVGAVSPHPIELLIDAGYAYMGNGLADEIPYYWVADVDTRSSLLTLPYYYHFDDQFFLMFPPPGLGSGLENPKPFLTNCLQEFDAQYRRGLVIQLWHAEITSPDKPRKTHQVKYSSNFDAY